VGDCVREEDEVCEGEVERERNLVGLGVEDGEREALEETEAVRVGTATVREGL